MAEGMLDACAEFAEGLVVLDNLEQRIVAETAGTAMFGEDAPPAAALDDGVDLSSRIGERGRTHIVGLAFIHRQRGDLREQLLVVGGIITLLAGVPCGIHTGAATKRRHNEAAVFTEHPLAD